MGGNGEEKHLQFGSPEGDSANLDDTVDELVSFEGRRAFRNGVGLSPTDRTVRIIVGRKGSGKTLYLRRLQDAADKENALYADDWQPVVFKSDRVLRVAEWYPGRFAIEQWAEIWTVATLRALVSHLLHMPELELASAQREGLLYDFTELYSDFSLPESIYDQVSNILSSYTTKASLDNYLAQQGWSGLKRRLREILRTTKPICFYLDALDGYFEHAPGQWLYCQLGLFQAVINFLGSPDFGPRLHVVIGIRDIVFSTKLASEHKMKYKHNRYVRTLDWGHEAINFFLDEKLAGLNEDYLMDPDGDTAIERWLGVCEIENGRGETEDIRDYLLRHTRLLPRDVVELGNKLCDLIDAARDFDAPFLSTDKIREVVGQVSGDFGAESLEIVAHHLAADAIPDGAVEYGIAPVYTGEGLEKVKYGDAMHRALFEQVKRLIASVHVNRFGPSVLKGFEERSEGLLGGGPHFLNVLWQHGLLGFIDGRVKTAAAIFYDAAGTDAMELPRGMRGYALHPILIDAVHGLRGTGTPVRPNA
jgi:hypothetical protein